MNWLNLPIVVITGLLISACGITTGEPTPNHQSTEVVTGEFQGAPTPNHQATKAAQMLATQGAELRQRLEASVTATPFPSLKPTQEIEATVSGILATPTRTPAPTPAQTSVAPTTEPTTVTTAIPTPTVDPTPTPSLMPTGTPTATLPPAATATPVPAPTVTATPTRAVADDPSDYPPFPNIYSGGVLVGGQSAPNGTPIFARIGSYQTARVLVIDGRYSQLTVQPPGPSFIGRSITFHTIFNEVEIQAAENGVFRAVVLGPPTRNLMNTLDLPFPPP